MLLNFVKSGGLHLLGFFGWGFSGWELSWVVIFFGRSFPGGNCLVGIIQEAIFWERVFMLPPKQNQNSISLGETDKNFGFMFIKI